MAKIDDSAPPKAPDVLAPTIGPNTAAVPLAVAVALADKVSDVPEIAEIVALNGTLIEVIAMPKYKPVALATVAVELPFVVLIVVDTVRRLAAVFCMVSEPTGARPRRSGKLNVNAPSPSPHGNTCAVTVLVDVALLLTVIVVADEILVIVVPVGIHVASTGAPTRI